ncbi:MAG: diacylglycerol kinase family protein [Oscillospiraceae bacterium]|nr:diacylglycerol kinase family protein [Oscillospiraceae bacterium]
MKTQLKNFFKSFRYAAKGVCSAFKQERNMRFHLVAAVYVYAFSLFYQFTRLEYAVITICVAGVIALELLNTAVERAVEKPGNPYDARVGQVKDIAAGAVFIFSIGAAICGLLLFWRYQTVVYIVQWFFQAPWRIAAFLTVTFFAGHFIFKSEDK